jgi:putative transposase
MLLAYITKGLDGPLGNKMPTTSYESLSHSRWDCKYHVVFVPKNRKRVLYGKIRKYLAKVFHELANQKGCKIVKGSMVQDHVHMLISIPPKHSVSDIIGYIKGKSAIAVARQFGGKTRNFNGERFWARGYAVSTVGFETDQIKSYINNQEQLDGIGSDEAGNF